MIFFCVEFFVDLYKQVPTDILSIQTHGEELHLRISMKNSLELTFRILEGNFLRKVVYLDA